MTTARPALAHNHVQGAATSSLAVPLVAVFATLTFAGLLLARSVLGAAKARRAAPITATIGFVAIIASTPSGLWEPIALAVAIVALVRRPVAGRIDAVLGALVLAPLAVYGSALASTLMWVHLVVGSLWVGGVVHLALWCRGEELEDGARRFARPAIISVVVAIATGVANATLHAGTLHAITTILYGQLVVAKLTIVLVGTGLAIAGRRFLRARRFAAARRAIGIEAALFVPVLAIAVVLASLPAPVFADAIASGPLVRSVGEVSVVVDPYRSGTNRIHVIGTRDVLLSGRPVRLDEQGDGHITFDGRALLSAGPLQVLLDPWARRAPAHAIHAPVPDSTDCADTLQGRLIAVQDANLRGAREVLRLRGRGCPLDVAAASRAGTLLGHFLNRRGDASIAVVTDGDPRGEALRTAIGPAAPDASPDAVVIATDEAHADEALRAARRATGAGSRAIVLAPWLFSRTLLARGVSSGLVAAADFDPFAGSARRYATELAARAAGQSPSAAGLRGFAPSAFGNTLVLYAPVNVQILPEPGHIHGGDPWVGPGAGLTAISPVLR